LQIQLEKAGTEHVEAQIRFRRMSINFNDMNNFDRRSYALSEISQAEDWSAALDRLQITITSHQFGPFKKAPFFLSLKKDESEAKLVALVVEHIGQHFKQVLKRFSLLDVQAKHTFLNCFIEHVNLNFRGSTDLVFCLAEFEGLRMQSHIFALLEAKVSTLSEANHFQVQGELIAARAHSFHPPAGFFAALFNNFEMYIYDHPRDNLMRKFGPYGLAEGLKEVRRRLEAYPDLPIDLSHVENEIESAGGDLGGARDLGEERPGGGSRANETRGARGSPGGGEKRELSAQADGERRECGDLQQIHEVAGVGYDYVFTNKQMITLNETDTLCKFPLLEFFW
jgi:hypothetical protein